MKAVDKAVESLYFKTGDWETARRRAELKVRQWFNPQ
jgi:hypothetical protein